jgi:hypothetical protein
MRYLFLKWLVAWLKSKGLIVKSIILVNFGTVFELDIWTFKSSHFERIFKVSAVLNLKEPFSATY